MLSIIVHYNFCAQSTHKPVITWSLWDQDFLHRLHYKVMSEIFHIFRKCPNRLNFLQSDKGHFITVHGNRFSSFDKKSLNVADDVYSVLEKQTGKLHTW